MRLAPVLALAAVTSVCAIPVANNAAASVVTDILRRSDAASIGSVIEVLADALAKADVSLTAVLANVKVQDSSILTDILNDNSITILKRNNVVLPDNIDAIVLGFINAALAVGADVQAAVANIGINYSTLLSNIGNNNVVFIRQLPEIVDIVALVNAIADAIVAVGANVDAVIGNVNIQNSNILTDILNGNTVIVSPPSRRDLPSTVVKRNSVPVPANIDAILEAFINALISAGVNVQAALLNIGIDQSTLLSNIGNGNVIFVRGLPETVDLVALVNALVDAAVKAGVNADAVIANLDIQNSSILTDILNGNTIILKRNSVPVPANIDAIVLAFINAAVAAGADVQAAVANIGINYSTLLSNIGNNNVVFIRQLPETVDLVALVNAIANAIVAAGLNVDAVIANVNIQNSSILTDILNGNTIILKRQSLTLPANIDAIVLALIDAAVAAGVNVQAAVANIGIDYSTLLSNIGNNNVVFIRQLPELVDIVALVKAIANAAAAVGVDINALIGNIDIQNSSILTDILNGNNVTILKRQSLTLPANIDAIVLAFINALVAAGVNVQAALANINIDQSTLLSNIGNDNVVFIRQLPEIVDIVALVKALVNAAVAAGVNVNAVIANLNIDNSSILTDILNGNNITILKRNSVALPANIDAILLAFINAAIAAGVNVQAALANINIDQSTLLSNIANNNVIFIRQLPEIVDIAAVVNAIANAAAAVGVNVNALIGNINIQNSNILTDILNGNTIILGRRDLPFTTVTADILAVLTALVQAALDANIDVFATVLNANLNVVSILSNILNHNTITILPIFGRSDASTLDVVSTVLALVQAFSAIGIPVDASALNVFIQNSNIASNILNNNIISILGL